MDQYLIIALLVIILWLVGFGAYLLISNRQRDVEDELDDLDELLQNDGIE
jgi:hypothetical protein